MQEQKLICIINDVRNVMFRLLTLVIRGKYVGYLLNFFLLKEN